MSLQILLDQLNKELDSDFKMEDGGCVLSFDDMEVTILEIEEENQILFNARIGKPLVDASLEALYLSALMGNHLFRCTKGATISINPETGDFCLCKVIEDACKSFRDELENFVQALEFWKKTVEQYNGDTQDVPAEAQNENESFIRI